MTRATRATRSTHLDASSIQLVVGSLDALLAALEEGPTAAAWVWLEDPPGAAYRVVSEPDRRALQLLGDGDRRSVLTALPPAAQIRAGEAPAAHVATVELDAQGHLTGAWVPVAQHRAAPDDHHEPWVRSLSRSRYVDVDGALAGREGPALTVGPDVADGADGAGDAEPEAEPDEGSSRRAVADDSGPSAPAADGDPGPVTASPAGDAALRRRPHLDLPSTVPTVPRTEFSVSVYTDDQPFDPGEVGGDVVVEAPAEVTKVSLSVTLITSEHFVVRGRASRSLDLVRDRARSKPVTFTLQVAKEPPLTPAVITALFSYGGRVCGTVTRQWAWDVAHPVPQGVLADTTSAAKPLSVFPQAPAADLSVFVTASGDGLHYTSIVQTDLVPEYVHPSPAPWNLPELAPALVTRRLDGVINEKATPARRLAALESAGYEFWDAAPENFKDAFWKIIDSSQALRSIYVASAEPSIPWELMTPFRPGGPEPRELPQLGVSHAIGRWCRSTADLTAAPPSLPVRDAFVITPRSTGLDPLDAGPEVKVVRERMRGVHLRTASVATFDTYFLTHQASLLHFVCHGASGVDDDDVLYLDGSETLPSASLRRSKGLKAMCRARAPLVFINACSTGQRVPGLVGGAGFPLAFGDIGARAVIAPLWPVDSALAGKVAVELYEAALQPDSPPVAEILRTMRSAAYAAENADTYAAYAFYGDPTARLRLVD